MKTVGKWLYLIGMLVAVLVALFRFSADWLTWILMLAGILAGLFYFDPEDVVNFGIRYLVLAATAMALDKFVWVGPYLTGIFQAVVGFLGPVVLTVLVVAFFRKYFFAKK